MIKDKQIRVSEETKEKLDRLVLEKALKTKNLGYTFDDLIKELLQERKRG
jgi:hypothetical protein